jgi:hypothetical protein
VQDESEFKRRSHTPPRASRRQDATLTVCGFTAGGSGMVSTEAIPINRPRNQIAHAFDLIPLPQIIMITDSQRCNSRRGKKPACQ